MPCSVWKLTLQKEGFVYICVCVCFSVRMVGVQQWTTMDTHSNKSSYTLSVLRPDTTYQVKVVTQCLSKQHKSNEVLTLRTPEGCETLFLIYNLHPHTIAHTHNHLRIKNHHSIVCDVVRFSLSPLGGGVVMQKANYSLLFVRK